MSCYYGHEQLVRLFMPFINVHTQVRTYFSPPYKKQYTVLPTLSLSSDGLFKVHVHYVLFSFAVFFKNIIMLNFYDGERKLKRVLAFVGLQIWIHAIAFRCFWRTLSKCISTFGSEMEVILFRKEQKQQINSNSLAGVHEMKRSVDSLFFLCRQ